jgi:hypothetical protein
MVKLELTDAQYELLLGCIHDVLVEWNHTPGDDADNTVVLDRHLRAQCPPGYKIQTEEY